MTEQKYTYDPSIGIKENLLNAFLIYKDQYVPVWKLIDLVGIDKKSTVYSTITVLYKNGYLQRRTKGGFYEYMPSEKLFKQIDEHPGKAIPTIQKRAITQYTQNVVDCLPQNGDWISAADIATQLGYNTGGVSSALLAYTRKYPNSVGYKTTHRVNQYRLLIDNDVSIDDISNTEHDKTKQKPCQHRLQEYLKYLEHHGVSMEEACSKFYTFLVAQYKYIEQNELNEELKKTEQNNPLVYKEYKKLQSQIEDMKNQLSQKQQNEIINRFKEERKTLVETL